MRHFHHAASRTADARLAVLANSDAAHGLEQQVIHALIQCLSARPVDRETEADSRYRGLVARFEDLLPGEPFPSMDQVSVALGVSKRMLREYCQKNLGTGPDRYRRRRGMQLVRRALRSGAGEMPSVTAVARKYGFRDLGRFATNYRALYGELPSMTLRRARFRG
jgi:AraC family ethanolamine operon transcriptional activator